MRSLPWRQIDASIQGLGAVLSQKQADRKFHPVAYTSRALSPTEKNYSVTELEKFSCSLEENPLQFVSLLWRCDQSHCSEACVGDTESQWQACLVMDACVGRGIKIVYRAGPHNASTNTLSRGPVVPPLSHGVGG